MLMYFNFSFTFYSNFILRHSFINSNYSNASISFLSAVLTLPYGHLHNIDTFLLQTVDKQGE